MQCFYPTKTVCGILLFLNHPTPPQLQYEMHPGCWVGSVHFNMAEGTSTTGSKKAVPDTVVELVDVPIYTFGCESGLRSSHKIRGDPVLEGVAGFLGQLLQTSNPETQEMFATISPDCLVDGQPGRDHQSSCWHLFPRVWRHWKPNKLYVRMKTLKYRVVWLRRGRYMTATRNAW